LAVVQPCDLYGGSIAFLDLETTGLSPSRNRITEVGLVMLDQDRVTEWTTLVNPRVSINEGSRWFRNEGASPLKTAPFFSDIANELAGKLNGRLLIAHNARFDYAFLKAEFQRVGIEFTAPVVCSAMLSRKLYRHLAGHDLDALMIEHDLYAGPRHRALPDAQLVWQLWQVILREHSSVSVTEAIAALLAGPVLPDHLDPTLIDKLPDRPGVYFLHGEKGALLHIGHAANLRLHILNYFRMDRVSPKALELSLRIRNITFRATEGVLGARLLARLHEENTSRDVYTWKFSPADYPSVKLLCIPDKTLTPSAETFGLYCSERKARNALRRLATQRGLCHSLLGITDEEGAPCQFCSEAERGNACGNKINRLKHLTRCMAALHDLRAQTWPFPGPVGIRERADLHVLNDWRYVGSGKTEAEIHELVAGPLPAFDERTYLFLRTVLPTLARKKIVNLSELPDADHQELAQSEGLARSRTRPTVL
jgi:DNA polymerase-3 subunit epsilon